MLSTRSIRPLLAPVVLAIALGACGGGASTAAPAGPAGTGAAASSATGGGIATQAPGGPVSLTDACSLLTADDIQQATGFKPTRQTPSTDPGLLPIGCEWELDNPGETPWGIVIGVRSPGGRGLTLHDGDPIEGVGDAAVQTEPSVVEAVKDDTYISVTYFEFPERAAVAVELARLILAKV